LPNTDEYHLDDSGGFTVRNEAAEYLPAGQSTQESAELLPVSGLYLPAPQRVQTDAAAAEYEPAGQSTQASAELLPVSGLYLPALHAVTVLHVD
jgi:hypothetical protein